MRAIIINDADARSLLNQLELAMLRNDRPGWTDPYKPPSVEDMHRVFHFIVTRWLQEQGADVVSKW